MKDLIIALDTMELNESDNISFKDKTFYIKRIEHPTTGSEE